MAIPVLSHRGQSQTNTVKAQDYGNSVLGPVRYFAGGLFDTSNNDQLSCLLRNSTEAPKSIAKQTTRHACLADESRFQLCPDNHGRRAWRRPGQRADPSFFTRNTDPQPGVMAKNKALSLNPAATVEEKQFKTNIENMIKSIKTLSLPVPTRSENFNLFFQSLERSFLTKKINDEYKYEILINLLGERAHNVLLYIKKDELNDYEKLKSIVLREFQVTPRECLNSFKNAVKSSGETYVQFAARLTANFQYFCSLRKVNSFESLCDLLISDKLFETLNKETATHIDIREAEDRFRPIDLAKECDIYISSRSGSRKKTPIACGYTEDPFKNRPRNYKPKIKDSYPQNLERQNKNCYICGDSSHCARDCEKHFKPKESNGHIHNRKKRE
ncbi:integrase catalytic domain-containing protein [Trichonephila clavipes]|nr:integrase catalytic domain-containing protein [Trichonephila clavipes]